MFILPLFLYARRGAGAPGYAFGGQRSTSGSSSVCCLLQFDSGLSLNLADSGRLAGQQAPRILLPLPPKCLKYIWVPVLRMALWPLCVHSEHLTDGSVSPQIVFYSFKGKNVPTNSPQWAVLTLWLFLCPSEKYIWCICKPMAFWTREPKRTKFLSWLSSWQTGWTSTIYFILRSLQSDLP